MKTRKALRRQVGTEGTKARMARNLAHSVMLWLEAYNVIYKSKSTTKTSLQFKDF